MRRLLLAAFGALALLVVTAVPALAHPLGNFTVNHFSRVSVTGDRLRVHAVLDYAEIPAFQERQRGAGAAGYEDRIVRQVAGGLRLTVDGRAEPLSARAHALRFLSGQGGLETMRLDLDLEGPALPPGPHAVTYRDAYEPDRLGWREVVAVAGGGATLSSATVPAASVSDELRRYPEDRLSTPLRVDEARFTAEPGASGAAPPITSVPGQVTRAAQDRFAALVGSGKGPAAVALALLAAVLLGALHALEPGHGKAVMAGYLVGTRGTPRHAVLLALSITVTHTAGVFLLGLAVLFAAQRVAPERLYPWLSLLSGLLILGVGASLVAARLRGAGAGLHDHHHHGPHHHHHEHQGSGKPGAELTVPPPSPGGGPTVAAGPGAVNPSRKGAAGGWSAVLLGVSGGIVPCPSALVVLLAAVSLHRVGFGLGLIVAFSAGLALVLTGVGLAVAGGRASLRRLSLRSLPRLAARIGVLGRLAPVASAGVVTLVGLAMTVQAVGVVR